MAKKKVKQPTKTYRQRVLAAFIQDRSGSMQATWKENLNGFRVFIDELRKKDDVDYFVSLTPFDTIIDTPAIAVPLAKFNSELLASYPPNGGTALYDAVGATIEAIDRQQSDFDKVIVIIVTDGEENSSTKWNKDKLHSAIDTRLARGNWTFQYLGTQPETWDDARQIGLSAGSTVTYTAQNTHVMYANVAEAMNNFSGVRGMASTKSLLGNYGNVGKCATDGMLVVKEEDDLSNLVVDLTTTSNPV
jgi:uncharacterized protein YegL